MLPCYIAEIAEIKKLTKTSLDRQWKNCLSHDWISAGQKPGFPLREFYVELKWSREVRKARGKTKKAMASIYDILDVADAEAEAKNILIEGKFV